MLLEIISALSLVLVLEGLLPSICPQCWRNSVRRLISQKDRSIRAIGLASMLIGASVFIYIKRTFI